MNMNKIPVPTTMNTTYVKAVASEDPSFSELVLASLVPSKTQVITNTKMLHDPVAAYLIAVRPHFSLSSSVSSGIKLR